VKTSISDPPKPFHLDLNLDDEVECREFVEKYPTTQGSVLARALGLKGKGAASLATSLSDYAHNKAIAMAHRLKGDIDTALCYENNCDRIYQHAIQPFCDCW
jgi:hypothetical protein